MEHIQLGSCKMWSLEAGGLSIQVVFRACLYTRDMLHVVCPGFQFAVWEPVCLPEVWDTPVYPG